MGVKSIAVGGDHAGYEYKAAVQEYLESKGHTVLNFGTNGPDSVDYPDFVHTAANAVENGQAELGLLFCGSGNGVAMTANKHQEIRCALAWDKDLARLAREHNNANMLAIPCRFVSEAHAIEMVDIFVNTGFEGGRHERRVAKIACI